jgi:hypothetical protein
VEAARYNGDKMSDDVKANVAIAKSFIEAFAGHLSDEKEKWKCLARMGKCINRKKVIA